MSEISIKKSATINAIAKYLVVVINIIFSAVLARILTPNDYGVIAIVTIFTTLFNRIADLGFGTAIIQRSDLSRDDINQIYSFTGYAAVISGVAFAAIGYPLASYYDNSVYCIICPLLSIAVFFNTLNMIPNAILMRDKLFARVGIRAIIVNIVGYVVAVAMAALGFKYYSLVFQLIIAAILNFIWNNYTVGLKFNIRLSLKPIKSIINYSGFQFAFNWVNYFETNLDNILIAGLMGSTPLAYYDKAYKLLGYPVSNLAGVITPVLHPILKDYQYKRDELLKKYIKIQRILSILSIYFFLVFFCASEELIVVMYGQQWDAAVIAFHLLCISIYPAILMSTTGAIYCSIGNTKLLFIAGLFNAGNTAIWIITGIFYGSIEAVALCVSVANWINTIVTFSILIGKGFGKNIFYFFKLYIPDIVSMVIITIIVVLITKWIFIENRLLLLCLKIWIITVLYFAYLVVSKKLKILFDILPQKLKAK